MAFHELFKGYCTGPFGFPMLEEDARALDKELENAEEEIGLLRITKGADKSNHFIEGERADVSVITDDSLDEDGEVVDIKGIDLSAFRKNPVVTFNHNYLDPPIAKSLWQKPVGNKIIAKTVYAPRPDDLNKEIPWFPDQIFGLVKSGFLPGKSIGGIAKRRAPTTEEIQKYGPNLKKVCHSSRIYEYSVVTRQANNNAIVEAVSKGIMTLPEKILSEFPDLKKLLPSPEAKPIIKSFRTVNDVEKELEQQMYDIYNKTPEMVEDVFARMLGKV
jgi:hypothetical protein